MDTTNQRTATQDQILIDAVKEHLNTWNSSENFEFIINFTNRLAEIVNYSEFLRRIVGVEFEKIALVDVEMCWFEANQLEWCISMFEIDTKSAVSGIKNSTHDLVCNVRTIIKNSSIWPTITYDDPPAGGWVKDKPVCYFTDDNTEIESALNEKLRVRPDEMTGRDYCFLALQDMITGYPAKRGTVALHYLQEAIRRGNVDAVAYLGRLRCVIYDEDGGILSKALELGSSVAPFFIAYYTFRGIHGFEKDENKAIEICDEWIKRTSGSDDQYSFTTLRERMTFFEEA